MAFKLHNPACIFLNRGNHENMDLTKLYGFEGEVLAKYCRSTYNLFLKMFNHLPLGTVLNKKVYNYYNIPFIIYFINKIGTCASWRIIFK